MENSKVDDIELMKDPGFDLKDSLDAAFTKNDITVSEDLISATLTKIRALETENTSAKVVNISDRKKKIRTITRIAVPVAAALFIGILGINLINNGKMSRDTKGYGTASNSAESYVGSDKYEEEPAAVTESSSDEGFFNESKIAAEYDYTASDNTAEAPAQNFAPVATCAPTLSYDATNDEDAESGTTKDTTGFFGDLGKELNNGLTGATEDSDSKYVYDGSSGLRGTYKQNALYCFRVPEELVEKSMETVVKYIDTAEETDELAATTGNGGYLVIGSDYLYFTTDESLEQENDEMIHHIVGSDDAAEELAEEIEELLNNE